MNPRYPVYIVSKGRWASRLTSRALERMGVPYSIVVEPPEQSAYEAVIEPRKVLTLPFANLGQGSIPARNWVWEHARAGGHARHWILDDNICVFRRAYRGRRLIVRCGAPFCAIEDFADRYLNVALAGMQYVGFASQQRHMKPYMLNTRTYSCILIDNALPFRWRGRYNEDTDLSLRVLKAGYCTILTMAFLCHKQPTLTMRGGNTDTLYRRTADYDGRLEMARSLRRQHPDVVEICRRWGRWQHLVNYAPFRGNKLLRNPAAIVDGAPNEYGMVLRPTNAPPTAPTAGASG